MTEIHKLICDICGKEKDYNSTYSQNYNWQELLTKEGNNNKKIHTCSIECSIKWLQKSQEK